MQLNVFFEEVKKTQLLRLMAVKQASLRLHSNSHLFFINTKDEEICRKTGFHYATSCAVQQLKLEKTRVSCISYQGRQYFPEGYLKDQKK